MNSKRAKFLMIRSTVFIVFCLLIATVFTPFVSSIETNDGRAEWTSLEYSFSLVEPYLELVTLYDQTFTSVSLPGAFTIGEEPGTPVFQVTPIQMLLPYGTEVKQIEVRGEESQRVDTQIYNIDLKETPIFPYQQPLPIGSPAPHRFTT